jgi:signal transduction histidine kinase
MTNTRILVVDDTEAARYTKTQVLRREGYQVTEASTGTEALEAARTVKPDLIVLDVNLPDISGLEVCRRIKAEYPSPMIQVLQVSQTAVTEDDRARGLDQGADMYLIEPFGPTVLLATVRALLRVRTAELAREHALDREKQARAEAERANRMKDEFVAMVSHELRTPLNAVTGAIWLLKHGPRNSVNYDRAVDVLDRNARVQVQLIDDLLDVSKISTGKLDVKLEPIDLKPVVEAAVAAALDSASHRRKNIRLELHAVSVMVLGDPARLQQVVSNILNNAFQFTPDGGSIAVSSGLADDMAFVRVRDSGAGIEPELLPHVFERFRQGRPIASGRDRGLGLGLAIVDHLVNRHNGRVKLESEGALRGTTCMITLPALAGGEASTDVAAELSRSALAGVRLLVVEDDPDAREVLESILGGYGAKVVAVDSGGGAIQQMNVAEFDVLVSDIGLPDFDGVELVRRLRTRGRMLPAVAVTAFATEDDQQRLLREGFQAHVAKPVDPRSLVQTVARAAGL